MKIHAQSRSILCLALIFIALLMSACSKSPEDVREWLHDKRAPVKMKEFIQDKRNPIETKIEALMILVERNNSTDIPAALAEPLKFDEVNRIVAGAIPRMQKLIETDEGYLTRVKDAAYYLLKLDLNDENADNDYE